MLQLLERAADRMVSAVVPKTKAGACACFPSDNYWQFCWCGPPLGMSYYRFHRFDCWCNEHVGGCEKHLTDICL